MLPLWRCGNWRVFEFQQSNKIAVSSGSAVLTQPVTNRHQSFTYEPSNAAFWSFFCSTPLLFGRTYHPAHRTWRSGSALRDRILASGFFATR